MILLLVLVFGFFSLLYLLFGFMAIPIILLVLAAVLTLVYSQQNKLLYMPVIPDMSKSPQQNPHPYRHPSQHQLKTIDVQLETKDGTKIRGWHVKAENSERIIIYFHENAGNLGFRIPLIKNLSKRTNSDVVLIAYRGYSDSDGIPTQLGLQMDAQAILQYSLEYSNETSLPIFLYGRSLGGAVSIYLGSHNQYKHKINGLILQNTFTNISDMIDAIMPIFKYVKFLLKNLWPSIQRIPRIERPILFIRSLKDELVPTAQMQRLINNVDSGIYKEQYQIVQGTHNCSWELEKDQYFDRISKFLKNSQVTKQQ